ncbi:hypothetical protein DY000_02014151 [Brassica cretica]|uniref:Uncharacterized protein n=1 Tax=Brassica cretica TaxID=69181 RepID=A0ABQ7DBE0_BRACR|nr:hypothetical protein DY000_02014151 [Brassica cretica]
MEKLGMWLSPATLELYHITWDDSASLLEKQFHTLRSLMRFGEDEGGGTQSNSTSFSENVLLPEEEQTLMSPSDDSSSGSNAMEVPLAGGGERKNFRLSCKLPLAKRSGQIHASPSIHVIDPDS